MSPPVGCAQSARQESVGLKVGTAPQSPETAAPTGPGSTWSYGQNETLQGFSCVSYDTLQLVALRRLAELRDDCLGPDFRSYRHPADHPDVIKTDSGKRCRLFGNRQSSLGNKLE